MDHYDPRIYDGAFADICHTHRNVIPVRDYAGHRNAVNRAVAEVLGPIQGPLLQSLMGWSGDASGVPTSQAMLLWIKETQPRLFEDVLAKAKQYDSANAAGARA
ncbi:MAG TPA: hypothetical protein VG407_16945 [Caulobacteraceae bacterium]|jgi:hypothetical protein|nr:hypothetical protein [Caulobacteraceae bacterium]